jgi:pimeloyl-ACP methyl ester carboxylesterase
MSHEERLLAFRASYPNKSLTFGGRQWHYRICGEGARTLLLLPGGELVNDLGFNLAGALAQRFRIVYPAYPRADTLAEFADGIDALLTAENAPSVWVLGASFGGAVAQCLVRRHPERIDRLILSNTGVPQAYLVRTRTMVNATLAMLPWPVLRMLLIRSLTKVLGAPAGDMPFWRAYFKELFATRLTRADVLSNLRNQLEYHARYAFSPDDLAAWSGKIFIIESDNDLFGPKRRKALRDTYPQAPVYTFHGGGNAPAFSRTGEYMKVLDGFLE